MPTMIKRWMARGQAKSVILFLATRFDSVPETLETRVKAIQEAELLDELTRQAAACASLDEFVAALDAQS